MGTVDVYRITNQLDDATLDVLLTRLEARGKHPRFADMLREYLDAMAIDSARSVLDLGCGTGVAARAIACRPSFSGRITGIDRSPHLIGAAARLAHEEGLAAKVDFRIGDSHTLELRTLNSMQSSRTPYLATSTIHVPSSRRLFECSIRVERWGSSTVTTRL